MAWSFFQNSSKSLTELFMIRLILWLKNVFASCIVKVKDDDLFAYAVNVSFVWHPFAHLAHMLLAVQAQR